MILKEINEKTVWEDFLGKIEEKTFLQSWNWGEFQKELGNKIWRFGVYEKELIGVSLVVKIKARRGTFLFLPHGPLCLEKKKEVLSLIIEKLKKEKVDFIRIAPLWEESKKTIFKDFRPAPIHMHPEITWVLDITPSEEKLLIGMRKTTRYLIKQGIKNGDLEISKSKDIKTFNDLYLKVAKRHNFVPFSLEFLKKQFSIFSSDNQIEMFLGKYKDEVLASAIVVYWQDKAFYHHGATAVSKIPASYLLQWEAIKEAKKRGCKEYNFWGVVPEEASRNHPWRGLTLFKKGFGGCMKKYVKTQDLVLNKKYWINWTIEKIRHRKRGL